MVLQPVPISCHFQGCKAPLSRIVSGAISTELPLPLPFTPDRNDLKLGTVVVLDTVSQPTYLGFKRSRVRVSESVHIPSRYSYISKLFAEIFSDAEVNE